MSGSLIVGKEFVEVGLLKVMYKSSSSIGVRFLCRSKRPIATYQGSSTCSTDSTKKWTHNMVNYPYRYPTLYLKKLKKCNMGKDGQRRHARKRPVLPRTTPVATVQHEP